MGCKKCRFRLMINDRHFQCAASPRGWAYIWDQKEPWRSPNCARFIKGNPLKTNKELNSAEFWAIAGAYIRPKDWEKWQDTEPPF